LARVFVLIKLHRNHLLWQLTHSTHHFPFCFNYSCLILPSSAPQTLGKWTWKENRAQDDKRNVMLAFNWILKPHNWNRKASQILTSAPFCPFHSTGNKSVVKISPKVICAKQVGFPIEDLSNVLLPSLKILVLYMCKNTKVA